MKTTLISKTFNFGKVAYTGNRRSCAAEVKLELYNTDSGVALSICGAIWNHIHTDCYTCGQNLDTMKHYLGGNPTFMKLYTLWKSYHLNDMKAGTARQSEALEKAGIHEYRAACDYLKSIGLYVDTLAPNEHLKVETETASRNHYEYGHGWITREIPAAVIDEIYTLCGYELAAVA